MAQMIANKSFTYATRRLQAGDAFTAYQRDVAFLVKVGSATLMLEEPEAAPAPAKKPKGKSKPVTTEDGASAK